MLLLSCVPLRSNAQTLPSQPVSLAQTLQAAQGRQRLLLVLGAHAGQADFKQQLALLASRQPGLTERDFRVLALPYNQLSPADRNLLLRKLGKPLPAFAVVLIGKDGGVKLSSRRPVPPSELFAFVDQMPMRRQEVRRQTPVK